LENEALEPNRLLLSPAPHPPTSLLAQVDRPFSNEDKMEDEEDSPWDRWVSFLAECFATMGGCLD